MGSLVAKGYADALFELGLEDDKLVSFKEQGTFIKETLSDDLMRILTHPKISKIEKKNILDTIYKQSIDNTLLNTMKVMIDKNRFVFYKETMNEFEKNFNKHYQITVAYVNSAVECSDEEKKRIQAMLEKKLGQQVECRWFIDQSLLAGLRIKINDQVLDNSAVNRLNRLKEQVVNTALK